MGKVPKGKVASVHGKAATATPAIETLNCRIPRGSLSSGPSATYFASPARNPPPRHRMHSWRYRVLPLLAKDGMSFEVIVASDNEANARRQVQAQYPSARYQIAYLGEVR